ncbi:hypothetical protein [Dactylosporangium darangshiense]|uniref:Uncharacterized protein n=1 Tax=Dactylosporangium darangshiense TaxID=579108 RepID=A0ABP8DLQ8_9ACTN
MADELARRGHRLVAVRIVDHFSFDPTSWWYGKPGMRPEFTGWWDVFSVFWDPSRPAEVIPAAESAAVKAIARRHGGVADGPGGGLVSTVLDAFTRVGLVHELADDEVVRRLAALTEPAIPPRPGPRPAARLAYRANRDEHAEMAAIAERLTADEEPADGAVDDARDDAWDEEWADAGDLLGALFDGAMHQGTCYPHTASMVPTFVALATDERIGDRYHAWILMDLFMIATVGRRDLSALADTRHALGQPQEEAPEAVAARRAVADSLARLTARWDTESELGQFFLAALVAACPEAGAPLRPAIKRLRQANAGTARDVTVRLVEALADADPQLIEDVLRDISAWNADLVADHSPYATAEQRGLSVLEDLISQELHGI